MVGDIDVNELSDIPINQFLEGINLSTLSVRLLQLKEKMPKKGRLYYQLLEGNVKEEVDGLIADLKKDILPWEDPDVDYSDLAQIKVEMPVIGWLRREIATALRPRLTRKDG